MNKQDKNMSIKNEVGQIKYPYNSSNTMQILLNNSYFLDAKNNEGRTALMVAAMNGNIEIIQALLDKGANVYAKDNKGMTALVYAANKGNIEIVKLIKQAMDMKSSPLENFNITDKRAM